VSVWLLLNRYLWVVTREKNFVCPKTAIILFCEKRQKKEREEKRRKGKKGDKEEDDEEEVKLWKWKLFQKGVLLVFSKVDVTRSFGVFQSLFFTYQTTSTYQTT
jgi:hypothetical protein